MKKANKKTYKEALAELKCTCVNMVLAENSENTYAKVKATFIKGFKKVHGGISPTVNQVNHYMSQTYKVAQDINLSKKSKSHTHEVRCF